MKPTPGDRWMRQVEVLSVTGQTVRMKQNSTEFDLTLAEYDTLSETCLRAGDQLIPGPTKVEDDDIGFE